MPRWSKRNPSFSPYDNAVSLGVKPDIRVKYGVPLRIVVRLSADSFVGDLEAGLPMASNRSLRRMHVLCKSKHQKGDNQKLWQSGLEKLETEAEERGFKLGPKK